MKKALAVLAILAVAALALPASAVVDNGPHDLRVRLGIDEICLPCHAPHNGPGAMTVGVLFNHQLTTQQFTRNGANITLTGSTKMCMSCHDGVTAIGNFGTITNSTDKMSGSQALGTNLTATHPIGVEYPAVSDSRFVDISNTTVAGQLEDGKVECGSCHRPHYGAGGGTNGHMLRYSMTNSALCRNCHTF